MTALATHPGVRSALPSVQAGPARRDAASHEDPPPSGDALRSQASLLHATARHWSGADDALRRQTRSLLDLANRLHADPLGGPAQWADLRRQIARMPDGLRRIAGHLAALEADQPAPAPAPRKISPAALLHSALSRLSSTAKSARQALARHMPSPATHATRKAKAAASQDRAIASSPMGAELSRLADDLRWAEQRRDLLLRTPAAHAAGQAGRPAWARHTLGVLLAEAREAEARARQAVGRGPRAEAVACQAITMIRSKLTVFNASLDIAGQSTMDFKFLRREWPAATGVPG